jgi:hypothetical protein
MSELSENQQKFSLMIAEFVVWLYSQGFTARQGDAWRSTDKLFIPTGNKGFDDDAAYSYQELLFYNNKTKLTYGKHNDRLAQDLVIEKNDVGISDSEYRQVGEKWEAMGGRWGGRFGVKKEEYNDRIGWDANHFEL